MLLIQSTQTHSRQTFEVENIGLVGSSLSFLCTNLKQRNFGIQLAYMKVEL